MADVSSVVSGILLCPAMPEGQTCDLCAEPATVRLQGETDSFGAEWCDYCDHHAERVRAGAIFTGCVDCEVWFELADADDPSIRCPSHREQLQQDFETLSRAAFTPARGGEQHG